MRTRSQTKQAEEVLPQPRPTGPLTKEQITLARHNKIQRCIFWSILSVIIAAHLTLFGVVSIMWGCIIFIALWATASAYTIFSDNGKFQYTAQYRKYIDDDSINACNGKNFGNPASIWYIDPTK